MNELDDSSDEKFEEGVSKDSICISDSPKCLMNNLKANKNSTQDLNSEEKEAINISRNEVNRKRIDGARNRIIAFVEEIEDNFHNIYDDEGDPNFQTVLSIFRFFDRKYDILTILNCIHQCAGNISKTVSFLVQHKNNSEFQITSGNFNFKDIHATVEDIDKYFQY